VRRRLPLLLALIPALCLGAPQDEDGLPSEAAVQAYLEDLRESAVETVGVGELEVDVSVIPDYFDYAVARDYLKIDFEELEGDELLDRVKRLSGKHKTKRGKTAIFIRFRHERHRAPGRGGNFFALEGKLNKQITVEQVGRGKAKFEVEGSKGKVGVALFTLFQAQSSKLFRGKNVPPIIKRKYLVMPEAYALDLLLKKRLDERTKKIKVRIRGFLHFSGNMTSSQMDFSRGARGEYVKGGEVAFRLPLEVPTLPAALKALVN
jgi:hypothetical protein